MGQQTRDYGVIAIELRIPPEEPADPGGLAVASSERARGACSLRSTRGFSRTGGTPSNNARNNRAIHCTGGTT